MRKLLYSPWQTLEVPSALTPIGQLHQSPPLPVPGGLGRCPSHQSHVLEHRDTYGQVQGRSGGHQGSSVSRRCQLSCGQALASTGSATSGLKPELSLSVLFSETQLGVLQTNLLEADAQTKKIGVNGTSLRVEFLLKTESGYLRDAEVTLFTLANP